MQQLPKIVKERLAPPVVSDHPDADMLTAFAEQSLPGSDRAMVMEHLARCGDCREVLALALPEIEEGVTPVTWRRPWFSMPVLRWGAIAAAFVVVVSVGVVRYRQGAPQMTASVRIPKEATIHSANEPVISTTQDRAQPSPGSAVIAGADKASPMAATFAPSKRFAHANAANREKTASEALVATLPAPAGNALKSAPERSVAGGPLAARARPSSPVPAQRETVEVAAASPALSAEQSELASHQAEIFDQTEQRAGQGALEERTVVGKAKAPVGAQALGSPALARNSGAAFEMKSAPGPIPVPNPRWMITSAGGLQRSYDEGKTWQDVSVVANSAAVTVALQRETSALSAQNAPQLKKQKDSVASPILRAISASGLEIWAGAAGGVLYHSFDSGNHWTSIIPSDNGVLLTGDIVSLQFADASHGKLATSTSEIWTTSDGGQRWSKQ